MEIIRGGWKKEFLSCGESLIVLYFFLSWHRPKCRALKYLVEQNTARYSDIYWHRILNTYWPVLLLEKMANRKHPELDHPTASWRWGVRDLKDATTHEQGSHGRRELAREPLNTWGWPAAPGKADQPWCPRAGHGPGLAATPAALKGMRCYTKGTFQVWQHTLNVVQCWTAPWPHHAKSHPKRGKKPGHHCNSQM